MKIKADLGFIDIIVHSVVWVILIVITLGVALFFQPYALAKLVINNTSIMDDQGNWHRVSCEIGFFDKILHILLWMIISFLTLGVGYFFYYFRVWHYAINESKVR